MLVYNLLNKIPKYIFFSIIVVLIVIIVITNKKYSNEITSNAKEKVYYQAEITLLENKILELETQEDESQNDANLNSIEVNHDESEKLMLIHEYDSHFLSFADCSDVNLYRFPDASSKVTSVLNGRVIVYNTVKVYNSENKENSIWAYVEFVDDEYTSELKDWFGYVQLDELKFKIVQGNPTNQVGIAGITVGSSYEDVISTFGRDVEFTKDPFKGWYTYHKYSNVLCEIDKKTLTVESITLDKPYTKDFVILKNLKSNTSWSDLQIYLQENNYTYTSERVSDIDNQSEYTHEHIYVTIDKEIQLHFSRMSGDEFIQYITIIRI